MQKHLADKAELLKSWREHGLISEHVLDAFEQVPREHFVPDNLEEFAYQDTPLPLVREKTISQPSTVVFMTNALEVEPGDKVLEIGAGSGYQAALLAALVGPTGKVVSCDVIPELVEYARKNVEDLGLQNVTVLEMDGSQGCPGWAPFDKIILSCAAPEFPQPLIEQLKEDGVMIGPIGTAEEQEMIQAIKQDGKLRFSFLGQFIFSPLVGKHGFREDSLE